MCNTFHWPVRYGYSSTTVSSPQTLDSPVPSKAPAVRWCGYHCHSQFPTPGCRHLCLHRCHLRRRQLHPTRDRPHTRKRPVRQGIVRRRRGNITELVVDTITTDTPTAAGVTHFGLTWYAPLPQTTVFCTIRIDEKGRRAPTSTRAGMSSLPLCGTVRCL
jgi:hypothetical protein